MGLDGSRQRGRALTPTNVDYYALLSRAIEASKANPGQLRSAVYDVARVNLHREILWQNPEISDAELRTHLLALEDAIERVEATHSESYDNLVFRADDPVAVFAAAMKAPKAPLKDLPQEVQKEVQKEVAQDTAQPAAIFQAAEPPRVIEVVQPPEPQPSPEVAHIVEQLEVELLHAEPVVSEPVPAELAHVEPVYEEPAHDEPVHFEPPPEALEWEPPPRPVPVDLDAHHFQSEPAYEHQQPAETHGELVVLRAEPPMAMQSGPMLQAVSPIVVDYHPPSREFAYPPEPPARRVWIGIGSFIQLTAAALLAVAIFAVMTGQLNIRWLGNKQQQQAVAVPPAQVPSAQTQPPTVVAAAPAVPASVAPAPPPFPVPATYGVYVLHNDKLTELERFTIRVPDARVPISPEIREPARVVVPDGKVSFVVFRRELVNGAPEKVPVRVVAKIAREMTFTDGKAATTSVDNLWRIRNNAFDFRVAPVSDNRELIVIRPDADLVLPAGRYALVINGQGYDFAVAGKITSPTQCLERIETVNGAIYSECRSPQVN